MKLQEAMMTEHEQIDDVLAKIERPSYVTDFRFYLDNDWAGDPAVFVWAVLRDDVAASEDI